MAMPARWVEDVAGYAGAGVAGAGLGFATKQRADNDPVKVAIPLIPVVGGGLLAAFVDGWLASAGQGIAYGSMGVLGLFAQRFLAAQKQPSTTPSAYRIWSYPTVRTGWPTYGYASAGAGGGVIEI